MRNVKRMILCGAAAMALLTGCSGSNTETAAEETTTVVAETESSGGEVADDTAAEAEADAPQGSVVLGEYKGVEYTPLDTTVTDEEVEARLESLVAANPDYVEVDRAAQEGDTVNIDYVGTQDGVAFDGGTDEGYDLVLGSGAFIDGFEDGLIGAKKGDVVNVDVTFPEDYFNADLAGQPAVFEVTVNSVKEEQEAELNDDFVKKMNPDSDITTVDQYRESVRSDMEAMMEAQAELQMQNDVLEAVVNNAEFSDIDARVEQETEEQWEQMSNLAAMNGIDMDLYAAINGVSTQEELKELVKEQVGNGVKVELVVDAVVEAEGMTVADEDYEVLKEMYGLDDISMLVDAYGQEEVDEAAIQLKVLNFLTDNAVAKE